MNPFAKYTQVLSICLPRKLRDNVVREITGSLYAELEDVKVQHKELSTKELMELILLKRQPPHVLAGFYRSQYYSGNFAVEEFAIRTVLSLSVFCAIFFTLSSVVSVLFPEFGVAIRASVLGISATCLIAFSSLMIMHSTDRLIPALARLQGARLAVGRVLWTHFLKAKNTSYGPSERVIGPSQVFVWASADFYVIARVTMAVVVLLALLFVPQCFGLYVFSHESGGTLTVYPVLTHEFLRISRPLVAAWLVVLAVGTGISGFSKRNETVAASRIVTKSIGVCIGIAVLIIGNIFGKPKDVIGAIPSDIKMILDSIAPYVFGGLTLLCWIGVISLFLSLLRDVYKMYYQKEIGLTS